MDIMTWTNLETDCAWDLLNEAPIEEALGAAEADDEGHSLHLYAEALAERLYPSFVSYLMTDSLAAADWEQLADAVLDAIPDDEA